jgi:predicted carbohydrate-binding protein with CBM5 and CBM33 domain
MTKTNGTLGTILTAAALSIVLLSNLLDMRRAHGELEKALAQQKTTLEGAKKTETQLDALASGTQALASGGNANAQRIVATLKQNGVSIKAGANSTGP